MKSTVWLLKTQYLLVKSQILSNVATSPCLLINPQLLPSFFVSQTPKCGGMWWPNGHLSWGTGRQTGASALLAHCLAHTVAFGAWGSVDFLLGGSSGPMVLVSA